MTDNTAFVHPSAIIEGSVAISAGVHIGPFCCAGLQVETDEGVELKSHTVINGVTKIGHANRIFQFAAISEINQNIKYVGEPTRVEVGDSIWSR